MKQYTYKCKADIIAQFRWYLAHNSTWAFRGLKVIAAAQEPDEAAKAVHRNHKGFSSWDAPMLSKLAEQPALTEKQMQIVYDRMPKYAEQLVVHCIAKGTLIKEHKVIQADLLKGTTAKHAAHANLYQKASNG